MRKKDNFHHLSNVFEILWISLEGRTYRNSNGMTMGSTSSLLASQHPRPQVRFQWRSQFLLQLYPCDSFREGVVRLKRMQLEVANVAKCIVTSNNDLLPIKQHISHRHLLHDYHGSDFKLQTSWVFVLLFSPEILDTISDPISSCQSKDLLGIIPIHSVSTW